MYLKDTLELSPSAVAQQLVQFLGLESLASDDALQAAVSLATRVPESRQGDHAWTVKHPASDLVARGSKLCEWYGVDGWEEVRKYWQSRDETLTAALFPWSRLPCPAHPASDGPSESRRAGGAVPNALPHADAALGMAGSASRGAGPRRRGAIASAAVGVAVTALGCIL